MFSTALIPFIGIGLIAQSIDGALGMAYGVTSSTLLLGLGMAPALASASVHMAELATTGVSGPRRPPQTPPVVAGSKSPS